MTTVALSSTLRPTSTCIKVFGPKPTISANTSTGSAVGVGVAIAVGAMLGVGCGVGSARTVGVGRGVFTAVPVGPDAGVCIAVGVGLDVGVGVGDAGAEGEDGAEDGVRVGLGCGGGATTTEETGPAVGCGGGSPSISDFRGTGARSSRSSGWKASLAHTLNWGESASAASTRCVHSNDAVRVGSTMPASTVE